jgi:hypothetical protein
VILQDSAILQLRSLNPEGIGHANPEGLGSANPEGLGSANPEGPRAKARPRRRRIIIGVSQRCGYHPFR